MARDTQEVSGRNGPVGGPEPALRGGGLPLPALKHWRKRKGISQAELARRAGLTSDYLFKVESGRRACRPEAAELMADLLGVGLEALRTRPGAAHDMETPPKPERPKIAYRHVHRAYLKIMLKGAVGSAYAATYAAMDEWELEERLEQGTWEGALGIVRAREREMRYLQDALGARDVLEEPDLPEDVRSFLESVLEGFPDLDIHLLATARRREASGEGREALTGAMRELCCSPVRGPGRGRGVRRRSFSPGARGARGGGRDGRKGAKGARAGGRGEHRRRAGAAP